MPYATNSNNLHLRLADFADAPAARPPAEKATDNSMLDMIER
jgi:hypothetical protein